MELHLYFKYMPLWREQGKFYPLSKGSIPWLYGIYLNILKCLCVQVKPECQLHEYRQSGRRDNYSS